MATKTKTSTARVKLNVNKEFILIDNNLVEINSISKERTAPMSFMATLVANLAYYGFTLSKEAFDTLATLDKESIKEWWSRLEPSLKEYTGDSKNMSKYVVYKNFPREVLEKSEAEYWIAQIFMYWGAPNEWFAETEESRESMLEDLKPKVLHLANAGSIQRVLDTLMKSPAKWTPTQYDSVLYLVTNENLNVDVSKIPFKENMVKIVSAIFEQGIEIKINSATDILRLATGLSDGDVSLATNTRFKKFKRAERKQFLSMMENSTNLAEDMMRYKGKWKRLMYALHPGDYANQFPGVCEAYNALYNGKITTFNSQVEEGLANGTMSVLDLLKTRPGEFMRRLNKVISVFGNEGAHAFINTLDKLSVSQLLKVEKYLESVNNRLYSTVAPKGNWTRLQILPSNAKMPSRIKKTLLEAVRFQISKRVKAHLVENYNCKTANLSYDADFVKLQTNDSELAPYGRGTVFPIPENIKFIRTASYWEKNGSGNSWFDNGWNFFDQNWQGLGTLAWNSVNFADKAAIFSGDPTNSKEMKGRGCQLIDLYLDKLEAAGVRYAVWNILCYSHIKFSQATDVFAAIQWGEEAQKGKLFEPSRAQLAFPLEGDSLTKYIAYIDIKERQLIYMDANLRGDVSSACNNLHTLSATMPAFVEYLNTLPSVYDLFKGVERKNGKLNVVYDDAEVELKNSEPAYVFKPVNEDNSFTQINMSEILS